MKTVVITGGSEGLGKAVAKILVGQYKVYILARNENKLKETAKELGCEYKVCDVAEYRSVASVFTEIVNESESIDILINNAGLWIEGKLEDNDIDQVRQTIDVNVNGVINGTKAVIPIMRNNKKSVGTIIQVCSQAGLYHKSERAVYNASKWAVTGFTKSIEAELASDHIRIMGFYPGKMDTGLFEKQGIKKDMSDGLDTEIAAKAIKFMVEVGDNVIIPELGIKALRR